MNEVQKSLQNRYPQLHPLIFQRSLERSKTDGELFDILETIPEEYPFIWDETERSWKVTDNLIQALIKNNGE